MKNHIALTAAFSVALCQCAPSESPEAVDSAASADLGSLPGPVGTVTTVGGFSVAPPSLVGPVKVTPHGTSIDVEFDLASAKDVWVEVGSDVLPSGYQQYSGPYANRYVTGKYDPTATHHLVHLTGLRPGKSYYVNVIGWKPNLATKTLYRMIQVSFDSVWDKWSVSNVGLLAVSRVAGTWRLDANATGEECYLSNKNFTDAAGCCGVWDDPVARSTFKRYCDGACQSNCWRVYLEQPSLGVGTYGSGFVQGLNVSGLYPGNVYAASQLVMVDSPFDPNQDDRMSGVLVTGADSVPLDVIPFASPGAVGATGGIVCVDPRNYVNNAANLCAGAVQVTVSLDLRPKNGQEAFVQAVPVHAIKVDGSGTVTFSLDLNYTLSVFYAAVAPGNALWITPGGVQIDPGGGQCQETMVPGDYTYQPGIATKAMFLCSSGDVVGNPVSGP